MFINPLMINMFPIWNNFGIRFHLKLQKKRRVLLVKNKFYFDMMPSPIFAPLSFKTESGIFVALVQNQFCHTSVILGKLVLINFYNNVAFRKMVK